MSRPIAFRREAQEELDDAAGYYEAQRAGLGLAFSHRAEEALDRIAAMPEMYPPLYQGIRRARLRQFPYSLFYQVEAEGILILAVLHNRRDPRIWRTRG